jgi:hypothetical protein
MGGFYRRTDNDHWDSLRIVHRDVKL